MTPGQRRMASFVRDNMFRAATMSIDELAAATGASAASANRFSRALGYDGYPAFRAALVRCFEANLAPVERLRSAHATVAPDRSPAACRIDETLLQGIDNLQATRALIDPQACATVVTALLSARRAFVLGYGASAFLAGLTEHSLTPYCPGVESLVLAGGPSHAARRLSTAGPGDVMLAIAFPRYASDTIELVRYAVKRKVRVFALTDCSASPLAELADISLFVHSDRRIASNSDAAVLMVIEALCDLAAHQKKDAVQAATDLTESVLPWLVQGSAHVLPAAKKVSPRRAIASSQKKPRAKVSAS